MSLFIPFARHRRGVKGTCRAHVLFLIACVLAVVTAVAAWEGSMAFAQDAALLERRQRDLKDKEDALRQKEERLAIIGKEVDEKIEKYNRLLAQMEEVLKKIEQSREERYGHLVKTYESMPPEEAAARLSVLDEQTAALILWRMKSKRAAAVMAQVEPNKAASLTDAIIKIEKKFPTK